MLRCDGGVDLQLPVCAAPTHPEAIRDSRIPVRDDRSDFYYRHRRIYHELIFTACIGGCLWYFCRKRYPTYNYRGHIENFSVPERISRGTIPYGRALQGTFDLSVS